MSIALALALSLAQAGPAASAAASSPPPSAQAFYDSAVQAMRDLPQPRYLDYTMQGSGDGLAITLTVERHLVWLQMAPSQSGVSTGIAWRLRHRTEDYATEIADDGFGRRLVSTRAFFDPTWYGAFRALREGMLFYQRTDAPVSAGATPAPGPSSDLRTIAVVSVIGSSIYRVEDAGPMRCDNGDEGHALRLYSRDRNPRHQLSRVAVDLRNMRFCTVAFNIRNGSFSGTVEQHYAAVGGYWLQTGGSIEDTERALGIAVAHGVWRYQIDYAGFPSFIAGAAFIPPYWQ
jgi:hypothetical protein